MLILQDLEDVLQRLNPRKQLSGKTVFHSWARMALPVRAPTESRGPFAFFDSLMRASRV